MDIRDYIPQRAPFVMVDELVRATADSAETRWTVPADNVLLTKGHLPAAGLMENVAQSAAAWIGKQAQDKHEAVRIGFIGAVKKMSVHRLPKAGETLETRINVMASVFDITLIHAEVNSAAGLAAEMDLKIALQ
ncbi:MAG: hydroxymyristoyl-ACP dehydratase [Paludibacteraceae bacterium]|nr:hydroxymyristoyl-ACP dehydratase [Paludibacteraceae bacterium]